MHLQLPAKQSQRRKRDRLFEQEKVILYLFRNIDPIRLRYQKDQHIQEPFHTAYGSERDLPGKMTEEIS